MKEKTCCFFGHRTINETEELKSKLIEIVEKLIVEKQVDTFLFGSKSRFNSLCLELVTELKEKYPHIKRIYVRAEYPDINEQYTNYLLESYEETYYPEHIRDSGRAAYVERNYEMINKRKALVGYNYNISDKTANDFADVVTKELQNNVQKKYDRYVVLRGPKGVFRNAGINY